MKKIARFFKISISSDYVIPLLLLTNVVFTLTNYILMKYIYRLMLVDTKYLVLWNPNRYLYHGYSRSEGPTFFISFSFLIMLFLVLYITNYKKITKKRTGLRLFVFCVVYFIISLPTNSALPTLLARTIHNIPYSPLEEYMKNTKINYATGIVETPFGNFKMHKKSDALYDKLYMKQIACKGYIKNKEEDKCLEYPYL